MKDEEICAEITHYSIAPEAHERKLGGRTAWRHDSDHSSSAAMSPTSPDLKDWNANQDSEGFGALDRSFRIFHDTEENLRLNRCTAAYEKKRTPKYFSSPTVRN